MNQINELDWYAIVMDNHNRLRGATLVHNDRFLFEDVWGNIWLGTVCYGYRRDSFGRMALIYSPLKNDSPNVNIKFIESTIISVAAQRLDYDGCPYKIIGRDPRKINISYNRKE